MRKSHARLIAVGFTLLLGIQALNTFLLSTPDGVRIHSPEGNGVLGRSFVVAGDAWMRKGIAGLSIELLPQGARATEALLFPAARDAVRSGGRTLFVLSSWSARIEVPTDGVWVLRAVVTGTDGSEATTPQRTLAVAAGAPITECNELSAHPRAMSSAWS